MNVISRPTTQRTNNGCRKSCKIPNNDLPTHIIVVEIALTSVSVKAIFPERSTVDSLVNKRIKSDILFLLNSKNY